MKKTRLFLTALLATFFLTACISPPQGLEKDEFTLQSIKEIDADAYQCQCKDVRFGGKILSVKVLEKQTKIEVLALAMYGYSAKPILDSQPQGRFMAYLEGVVDPETLKDQYITVKGKLQKIEKGKIDQADYDYPVVAVSAFKQWKLVQEYYYDRDWDDRFDGRFGIFGSFGGWGIGGVWHSEPKVRYVLR